MKTQVYAAALPVSTTVAPTAACSASGWESLQIQIDGTFVASYVIEGSLDGSTWFDLNDLFIQASTGAKPADPVTAPALLFFAVPGAMPPPNVRARCSAYTSGSGFVRFSGLDSRTT